MAVPKLSDAAVRPHPADAGTVLALKEWGAVVHALLQGRQTILLRKGGIHEKAFTTPEAGGGVVLFPTVAHSHLERTRPEHRDLLTLGDADVAEDRVVIRAGIHLREVVEVARPEGLPDLAAHHIWTDASIREDRVEFRPKHPLQVLVVATVPLPSPIVLVRDESHAGCRSWIDVAVPWDGGGPQVVDEPRLAAVADEVRAAVA